MLAILTTHPIQYQVPLWQALAKDGRVPFEVWYLTSHATTPSRDREFGKEFAWDLDMLFGYPHRFLDVADGATPGSFWKCRLKEKLRDRLRESNVRALWINGWQVAAYWQAVKEAKAAGVEVWLRGESNILGQGAWSRELGVFGYARARARQWVKRILLGQLFRRVDHFLCIGTANRELYRSYSVPDSKLHLAPYAVDNERFRQQAEALRSQRSAVRGQWSIPEDAFVILFCGKFIPKKRPMDLVEAATRLRREQGARGEEHGVHLLFAGSGDLGQHLRDACSVVFDADSPSSKLQAPSSTKPPASFAGFLNQTQVSRAYVAADVLVLPSDYGETWGLVVNEAMASGLPCVISDRCGCAEDLGRIAANEIYDCGNIESLARALMKIQKTTHRTLVPRDLGYYSFDTTVSTVANIWSR